MRRLTFLLISLFGLVHFAGAQDLTARFDEYIKAQVEMRKFNGSVLVARDGKVLFSKAYGPANVELDVPNTTTTKFRLGSITKQFTSLAIMQLQAQGKLSLDDTPRKYVPDAIEAWDHVTIRHLLTHTSGIPSMTSFPDYPKFKMEATTPEQIIARFKNKDLEFEPGSEFKYNNSAYYLLGYIVSKASGMSYEAYLQKNIFDPLDMNDSGLDSNIDIIKRRASGYTPRGDKWVNAEYVNMVLPGGAGALYSTVEDLLRWDQALYTEKLVSKKALEEIFTPVKNKYGYGWAIDERFNRKTVSHGGGIEGFNTTILRFPDDHVTVIALSNLNTGAMDRIGVDLAAIVFGEKYEIPRKRTEITVDPKIFDSYVGKFQIRPGFVLTVTRDGDKLMTQATGQGQIQVFPESETKFFLKVVDAQLTFVKDEDGKVPEVILHQNGRDTKAKRIE